MPIAPGTVVHMAKGRARGRRPPRKTTPPARGKKQTPRPSPAAAPAPPVRTGPDTLRVGAVAGATPGKWIDRWRERLPEIALTVTALTLADQREKLSAGAVDVAFVRLPIAEDGLHLIPLYDEDPVVVFPAESHLAAADELRTDDLRDEVVLAAEDAPPHDPIPGTRAPSFAPLPTVADAFATIGAGVGIMVVPASLARLHTRKDVATRPWVDGAVSRVALAWEREATDAADLIETFVGIVRGRTARSSRG